MHAEQITWSVVRRNATRSVLPTGSTPFSSTSSRRTAPQVQRIGPAIADDGTCAQRDRPYRRSVGGERVAKQARQVRGDEKHHETCGKDPECTQTAAGVREIDGCPIGTAT